VNGGCQAPGCGKPLPARRRRFCSDLCRIRGRRAERKTETSEFGRLAIRMIRQMAKRVGASDIATFGLMWEIMTEAEAATTQAITDLRVKGFTWDQIGREVGASKQTISQWHKRRSDGPPAKMIFTRPGTHDRRDHENPVNGSFTEERSA
jgi:hypothetical protein